MEDKVYRVKVGKTNKLLLCVIEFFICLLSLVVGIVLGNIWGLGEFINEILMELLLIAFSVLVFILFPNILRDQEIQAEFKQDYVVIRKKNSKKIIYYKDIAEVQKIMVLNRNHEEKGYYRVRVKHKGGSYVLYSTEREYDEHLDFEQVELSELYFEFNRRGVKCC